MAIQQIVWGHMHSLNDTIEAYQSVEGFALEKVNAAGSAIPT